MPSGMFSKQAIYASAKFNANYSDTVIGGALTTAPSGLTPASQFQQTLPGDRVIFSPADAKFWQNNNTQLLYTGTFRYVASRNNSSSAPTRGHGAFWDLSALAAANNNGANEATDALYQVTSDEAANIGVSMFAGVFINNMTKGNYWWIQESGKCTCIFRTTLTGNATIGAGVYLAGAGNNNNAQDVGAFDQLYGANAGTTFSGANTNNSYIAIDNMFTRFVGVAEQLPVANNNVGQLVDVNFWRGSYRW